MRRIIIFFLCLTFAIAASSQAEINPDQLILEDVLEISKDAALKSGIITVKDSLGNSRIVMSALESTDRQGGIIDLYNTADVNTLRLKGNNFYEGGLFEIRNKDGALRARMSDQISSGNKGGYLKLFNEDNQETVLLNSNDNQNGARFIMRDSSEADRIIFDVDYSATGDARVITDEIEIKGGSDLAEMFDITDKEELIIPGLLVSLDPRYPGKLMLSSEPYDKKIAGIISGANGIKPGILMGQDETIADGSDMVTLSGRTYVKANTTNGKIKIGDLITSSKVQGEAMRATSKRKSRGAIIGKAMTTLNDDSGFILVLVNLQ